MNSAPKAPPVFRPPNNVAKQRAPAPAVYRPPSRHSDVAPPLYHPQAGVRSNLQLKPVTSFKLESRPAPPVYRPQAAASQLKPATRVVQRMEGGGSNTPEENLTNLSGYRGNFLGEVERAFLSAGYNKDNIRAAILRGLQAWGGSIPGHLSVPSGGDSGEQGGTSPECEKAKNFLISWAAQNPAGTKQKKKGWTDDPEQFNQTQIDQVKRKNKKKDDSNINKHRAWHTKQGTPTGHPCPECQKLGL